MIHPNTATMTIRRPGEQTVAARKAEPSRNICAGGSNKTAALRYVVTGCRISTTKQEAAGKKWRPRTRQREPRRANSPSHRTARSGEHANDHGNGKRKILDTNQPGEANDRAQRRRLGHR